MTTKYMSGYDMGTQPAITVYANDTTESATQRTVSELLKLYTYQGMTDAEIQSLIDYYKQSSYNQGVSESNAAALDRRTEEMLKQASDASATAAAAFDAAIKSTVAFTEVKA